MTTITPPEAAELFTPDLQSKGFKVYEISEPQNVPHSQGRRDFYKIVLITGDMIIGYGDRTIEIKDTFLFFANPQVSHSVVQRSAERKGYACLFTEAFIRGRERRKILQDSPLFRAEETPVIPLNGEQAAFLTGLYQKMLSVHRGDYDHKNELLRSCIELILHEALQIQPSSIELKQKSAATRITYLFLELLERQFPVESTADPLRLRTAYDFAQTLSVHVNYLNRSVKAVTGKSTSVLIAERITAEAKSLLQHTDWSVADIAYSLGFEYPTYFNNYFKRVTGAIPKFFRASKD